MSTVSTKVSNLSSRILLSIGLSMEPCGTPLSVRLNFQSSRYPASSSFFMRWRKRPSWIFSLSAERISSCGKDPKQAEPIDHRHQIDEPSLRADVGDVTTPDLV